MTNKDSVTEYSFDFSVDDALEKYLEAGQTERAQIIESVIDEAKMGLFKRTDNHGNPEDTFSDIAKMWSVYLGKQIESEDVANMMILLKVCRAKNSPNYRDNWVDIIGYSACGAACKVKADR